MSKFKGTPGPWVAECDTHIQGKSGDGICEVFGDNTSYEEDIRNAKLITAAPDLLEALQNMVSSYEYEASIDNPALLAARAAISKALGGSSTWIT